MTEAPKNRRGFLALMACIAAALLVLLFILLLLLFQGQRIGMALTMGTGLGRDDLQIKVDALEEKVIAGESLSAAENEFLKDIFRTMATGGKFSWVLRQTGQMMDHYLDGTGEPLQVRPRIFLQSRPVREEMGRLRSAIPADEGSTPTQEDPLCSRTFNMIDPNGGDAKYGLYYGRICIVGAERGADGGVTLQWHAGVPWVWPTYEEMTSEFGDPHCKRSDIPNLRCLTLIEGWKPAIQCKENEALWVDDGLGAYLAQAGLARSFEVVAEWEEIIDPER